MGDFIADRDIRWPVSFYAPIQGSSPDGRYDARGRLVVVPGALWAIPGKGGSARRAGLSEPVVDTGPHPVVVHVTRSRPPWCNTTVAITGGAGRVVLQFPSWSRPSLVATLVAAGFPTTIRKTWFQTARTAT